MPKVHGDNYWLAQIGKRNARVVKKTVTFDGGAGSGATGTINLFTATGDSLAAIVYVCSTNLAGATATLKIGVAGATAKFDAQVTATNIVAGDVVDLTGEVAPGTAIGTTPNQALLDGQTVIATVATAGITAGVISVYCYYTEMSDGASVAKV